MKGLFILTLGLFGLISAHLVFLYSHRESKLTLQDFHHPFINKLDGPLDEDTKIKALQILDQPFTYLGAGRQMMAFESQDHCYVIKFFRPIRRIRDERFFHFKTLRSFFTARWIFPTYFQRKKWLLNLFHCYQEGFDALREETGLIYVHLHRATAIPRQLHLIDRDGKPQMIDLLSTPFVLQEKAELATTSLRRCLENDENEKAAELIQELKHLLISRAKKGYRDGVQTLDNNYGFFKGKAIQIDLGRISHKETIERDPQPEIQRVLHQLDKSLDKISPSLRTASS